VERNSRVLIRGNGPEFTRRELGNDKKSYGNLYQGQALNSGSQQYETGMSNIVCPARAKSAKGSGKGIVKVHPVVLLVQQGWLQTARLLNN